MEPSVEDQLQNIHEDYYRLLLLVGKTGTGKTKALYKLAEEKNCKRINLNLELSRLLKDLDRNKRAHKLQNLVCEIVEGIDDKLVLLDNIELLFSPSLEVCPLTLLRQLSRNRTVVASWPGRVSDDYLIYGENSHPEYRKYKKDGFRVLNLNNE